MGRDGVYLSSKIALHDYRAESSGRGVIATQNIAVSTPSVSFSNNAEK